MTGLREHFDAATEAPPPSRLLADEVYTAGRRRLRRRRVAGGAATALVGCALAGVALVALPGIGSGPSPEDRSATAASRVEPGVLPQPGRIQWAGAADAEHVYLALSTCEGGPCKTQWQLVGSDDGGRTWTERGGVRVLAGARVLGPDILLSSLAVAGGDQTALASSRDGGRSWQEVGTGPAVPTAPSGSTPVCQRDPDPAPNGVLAQGLEPCEVHAFDPASNQVSRLATQPPVILIDRQGIAVSGDRFWAPGFDPESGRPAITTSPDRGRTWSSHVFADEPACTVAECAFASVAVGSGSVAYALVETERARTVYRYTSEGWRRSAGAAKVPDNAVVTGSFVTPDGGHGLYVFFENRDGDSGGFRFWLAPAGTDTYRPVEPEGLPAKAGDVNRAADGWLYSRGDGDIGYGSTDGLHWVPLNRR